MKTDAGLSKLLITTTAISLVALFTMPAMAAPVPNDTASPTTDTSTTTTPTPAASNAPCDPGGGKKILGFPTWYQYLKGRHSQSNLLGSGKTCTPVISGLNDVWLIVAAVIEILLRIAVLIAIGFVVTGGVKFITGQGEPEKMAQARTTVINALIGLVIAVSAAGLISFIAGKFQ